MACECEQLPRIFNVETYPNHLMDSLELVDQKDGGWRRLYTCVAAGHYWQIDLMDKLQLNCAIKIDDPNGWQALDDKPIRVHYLINSRGGLTEQECVMAGCKNKALKSLAYCPKHAYDIGVRE